MEGREAQMARAGAAGRLRRRAGGCALVVVGPRSDESASQPGGSARPGRECFPVVAGSLLGTVPGCQLGSTIEESVSGGMRCAANRSRVGNGHRPYIQRYEHTTAERDTGIASESPSHRLLSSLACAHAAADAVPRRPLLRHARLQALLHTAPPRPSRLPPYRP